GGGKTSMELGRGRDSCCLVVGRWPLVFGQPRTAARYILRNTKLSSWSRANDQGPTTNDGRKVFALLRLRWAVLAGWVWRRRAYGRSAGRGWRGRIGVFFGTAQAGRIRRTHLRSRGTLGDGGLVQLNFFVHANDFFAVHFHDFKANNLVVYQSDEVHVLGRLAINPLFVFGFAILFANLL